MTTKKDDAEQNTKDMTKLCLHECRYLLDFKQFLRDLAKDAGPVDPASNDGRGAAKTSTTNGTEMRTSILTRNSTETYSINENELAGEVLICIWHHLLAKQCPDHFRIGIVRLAEDEINKELKNSKVQEELQVVRKSACEISDNKNILELLKLQKFIHQHLEKIFVRLSDNSKEDHLRNYADCIRNSEKETLKPAYAIGQIKNKPRKMEDRHMCLTRFGEIFQLEHHYSFYGVFDGHSGSLAATYASNQIPCLIAKLLREKPRPHNIEEDTDYHRDILEASFIRADTNFSQKSIGSGTTAVCALLKHDSDNLSHLYIAWVGDSRCLLVSPTVSLQLVKSHKPDSLDERKRIESIETGGAVIFVHGQWRVNGIINVSRSIGDYSVKAVISEPDFVDVPLQASHDFLILGSDGLYDHVTETEIVNCTYKALADVKQPLDDIPKHLIELAKQGDSQDNITVVLVLLKERSNIIENYTNSLEKAT